MTKPLQGRIALVAGATRGAGRGIACALGEAGATVYCTGRSIRGTPSPMNRPETIEETAELVNQYGGVGYWVRVDHTDASQVRALLDRIHDEQSGRLDILVNDIWGGESLTQWGKPFWEYSLENGLEIQRLAVLSHMLTSYYSAPLLVRRRAGLLVEITDGNAPLYEGGGFYYSLAKAAAMRLAYMQACDLRPHNVACVALTPGWLASEAMLEKMNLAPENWLTAVQKDPKLWNLESPLYVGRAVAALAADPDIMAKTGRFLSSGWLAREYGFTDIDGRQPMWYWGEGTTDRDGNFAILPPHTFRLSADALASLRDAGVPSDVLDRLAIHTEKQITGYHAFSDFLGATIGTDSRNSYMHLFVRYLSWRSA